MTIGIIGVIVNVLLNLILVGPLGIGGLALATTVTSTAKTVYLIWSLSRKMGGLNLKLIAGEQLKLFAANLLAVAACLGAGYIWAFSTEAPFTTGLQLVVYAYRSVGSVVLLQLFRSTSFRGQGWSLQQVREPYLAPWLEGVRQYFPEPLSGDLHRVVLVYPAVGCRRVSRFLPVLFQEVQLRCKLLGGGECPYQFRGLNCDVSPGFRQGEEPR